MKSIKIYLLPLLLMAFFSTQVFAQDDFYSDKKEKEKIEQRTAETDSILVHGYFTEKDYNEMHEIREARKNDDSDYYYADEIYSDEKHKKRENDSFMGEVAAEVIVEVVVNAVFIIAALWH